MCGTTSGTWDAQDVEASWSCVPFINNCLSSLLDVGKTHLGVTEGLRAIFAQGKDIRVPSHVTLMVYLTQSIEHLFLRIQALPRMA